MFFTLLKNGIGQSIDDLKWNYSMSQVYLLYEKCLKYEMDTQRMDAIIAANAAVYGSPAYSEKSAKSKQQHWKKFMDSLSWERVTKGRRKKTVGEIRKTFGALGIRVKGEKKGDQ